MTGGWSEERENDGFDGYDSWEAAQSGRSPPDGGQPGAETRARRRADRQGYGCHRPAVPPRRERGRPSGRDAAVAVIVGIVDDAVPFLNARFRDGSGRTRFQAVWFPADPDPADPGPDGAAPDDSGADAGDRRVLRAPEIDRMIADGDEAAAYRSLNARLYRTSERRATNLARPHGAMVADLACGAEPGDIDDVRILGVQLPPRAIGQSSGRQLEPFVTEALRWIVDEAIAVAEAAGCRPPLVVNLSLGALAGPKDGTGFVERCLADEAARYRAATGGAPVRIVLSYGNSRRSRQVALATIAPGGTLQIDWRIKPDDRTPSFVELRSWAGSELRLALAPPGGAPAGWAVPGVGRHRQWPESGRPVAAVYRNEDERTPDGERISVLLATRPTAPQDGGPAAPAGAWRIEIENPGGMPAMVALQIQRDDTPSGYRSAGRQSYFDHSGIGEWEAETRGWTHPGASPVTRAGTHSSFAAVATANAHVYAVGAADGLVDAWAPGIPAVPAVRPARYTAAGTTATLLSRSEQPTLAAFGDLGSVRRGVPCAAVLSGSTARLSGTSSSAPAVTRALVELARAPGAGLRDLAADDLAGRDAEVAALLAPPRIADGPAGPPEPSRLGAGVLQPRRA